MAPHPCPGPGCTVQDVPYKMLACPPHWFQVPKELRRAVYKAWANGHGAGTPAHARACLDAIETMRPLPATKQG